MVTQATPQPGRLLNYATPDTAAGGALVATPLQPPAPAAAQANTATAGGLKDAVEGSEGPSIYDKDVMLNELKLQSKIFEEQDDAKKKELWEAFRTSQLQSAELMVFVGMFGGMLRPFHTIQRYGGNMYDPSPFDKNIIAFVGDRKQNNNPRAYIMQEGHLEWVEWKNLVVSEAALKVFYLDKGNERKMYAAKSNDDKKDLHLPVIKLVPRGMVGWLAEKPRTPMQYHNELLRLCGGDDPQNRPPELSFGTTWCRAMCNPGPGNAGNSVMELQIKEVFPEDDAALDKWMSMRLDTTLGALPSTQVQPTQVVNHYHPAQPAGAPPTFGAGQQADTAAGGTIAAGKIVQLSELQETALQGFCCTMSKADIPPIWHTILNAPNVAEVRKLIMAAFHVARKELEVDVSDLTQFYLEDAWLKELQILDFAPGGNILIHEWLMNGISMLTFMNWTDTDICMETENNAIFEATKNTRTEEQVRRHNAKTAREPPKE